MNIVTTVTAASPNGYNLTDLATVHAELGIPTGDTSNDPWLTMAIAQISRAIRNNCSRVFQVEGLTDTIYVPQDPYPFQNPGGFDPLQLTRFPLVAVSSVAQIIGISNNAPVTQALTAGQDYTVDLERGHLVRLNPSTGVATNWESLPVIAAYLAGYGSSVAEPRTIPSGSPYTVTVINAAAFAVDQGVTYVVGGAALVAVASSPSTGQYSVNASTGVYAFAAGDNGKDVTVNYAYNQIPDDLTDAVLRMITERWWQRKRDPMLMSRDEPGKGSQRFWIPTRDGAFPPEISGLLDTYRVPVIG